MLGRFRAHEGGGVALIFAFVAAVLLVALGGAVDFSRAYALRSKAQSALDAGALAGVVLLEEDNDAAVKARVEAVVRSALASEYRAVPVEVTINKARDGLTARLALDSDTAFLGLIGDSVLPVSVESTVAKRISPEFDIFLAIDVSASMGVAASPADIERMKDLTRPYSQSATNDGCAFACHYLDGWEPAGENLYDLARREDVALREDVLREEAGAFARAFTAAPRNARIGLFGFSEEAEMLSDLTSDAAAVTARFDAFAGHRGDTRYDVALPAILEAMEASNAGRADAFKLLVIATDGVATQRSVKVTPLDTALCDRIKEAGYQIGVIDVPYADLKGDRPYEYWVRPIREDIAPALKRCASPGLYFRAEKDTDVAELLARVPEVVAAGETRIVE